MTPVVVSSVPAITSATWSGTLLVQARDEVAAVVHGHRGVEVENGVDVGEVGLGVLAADGPGGDALVAHERGGHVVLGRQRVRCAGEDQSAPPAFRVRRRLAVSVVTWRQAAAMEPSRGRSFVNRSLIDCEDRHVGVGPGDALVAEVGQAQVGDVVWRGWTLAWPRILARERPRRRTGRMGVRPGAGGP